MKKLNSYKNDTCDYYIILKTNVLRIHDVINISLVKYIFFLNKYIFGVNPIKI